MSELLAVTRLSYLSERFMAPLVFHTRCCLSENILTCVSVGSGAGGVGYGVETTGCSLARRSSGITCVIYSFIHS